MERKLNYTLKYLAPSFLYFFPYLLFAFLVFFFLAKHNLSVRENYLFVKKILKNKGSFYEKEKKISIS